MSCTAITKKALLCSAAALAIVTITSGPVAAADESPWTGAYAGFDVGYGDMNVDGRFWPSEYPGDPWSGDSGFVGGAHVGYDMQMQGFVLGIEADLMLTDFNSKGCNHWLDCPGNVDGSETADAEVNLLASLRARMGVPLMDDKALVYATGGVAYRDADWKASDEGLDGGDSLNDFGGVIGAGLEVMVSDSISARIEGLYYIFPEGKAPPDREDFVEQGFPGSNFKSNPIVGRIGVSIRF